MIFSVEGGCFGYGKAVQQKDLLLHDITFTVNTGEIVAVLGPNGAGKTTLLRCMMGFLPWQSGRSLLDTVNIRSIPVRKLWQRIAYVPQARSVSTSATVEELVLLGRASRFGLFAQPSAADREAAAAALERLHLTSLRHRFCSAISGGELQMVLIARALAAEPKVLVLDEPESNLDFKNQLMILDTISELASRGISCLFNTHYPAHALQRATRSLLLSKGGNYLFGPSVAVITEENIAATFGVEAVIGEIETKHRVYQSITPVSVLEWDSPAKKSLLPQEEEGDQMETRLAIIGIIVEDPDCAEQINDLLHSYRDYIVGRMGMPYEKKQLSIISVIVDAPEEIISTLSGKLGMQRGVSVKTTYSKR